MGVELLSNVQIVSHSVNTPLSSYVGKRIASPAPVFVSILRAGSIMVEGLLDLCPEASVGHIGLYRDYETLEPKEYLNSVDGNLSGKQVVLCDPILATGGSAIYAINLLKSAGAKNIRFACILAAEYGIKQLNEQHPDVSIFAAATDKHLDDHGYIVPGLGDAGDRIFDTIRKH